MKGEERKGQEGWEARKEKEDRKEKQHQNIPSIQMRRNKREA